MHLNALYRSAQAGKQALNLCMQALRRAAKWNGYAPRALVGKPLKYWHLRHAREHLAAAKQHLQIVRDNVSRVAALGTSVKIDSSGGYAVADLLVGGLLDALAAIQLEHPDPAHVDAIRVQVEDLMLRMRKAGAVG